MKLEIISSGSDNDATEYAASFNRPLRTNPICWIDVNHLTLKMF